MRRLLSAAGLAACALGASACNSAGAAGNLNAPTTARAGAVVIEIVGIDGARSFSPNPATVPRGTMVVWHNADTVTHRVVLNDGGLDTKTIAPGAFSEPTALVEDGPYHCVIHPPMIGTVAR